MFRLFVSRPLLATALAMLMIAVGLFAMLGAPLSQYPNIAPPAVSIKANDPGASAQTTESAVTAVLEAQLSGIDGLVSFSSTSDLTGGVSITASFATGTDPDIDLLKVQNRVQLAMARLPLEVQRRGVRVSKAQSGFLSILALYDPTDRMSSTDLADLLISSYQDAIARVSGVGDTVVFGRPYAMRIWLDPTKLSSLGLTPNDVIAAIAGQNSDRSAGQIGGAPSPPGQALNVTVTGQSRLRTPQQFGDIVLRGSPGGAVVRLADVARVELGNESYDAVARFNGWPAAGLGVQLAPGANALKTSAEVQATAKQISEALPPGVRLVNAYDSTDFIRLSMADVVWTLLIGIALVVLVTFAFLKDWRATIVPAITIPVVLCGTVAILRAAGFSLNTLTLFAMVLGIGLLVDDAVVVVESAVKLVQDKGLTATDATLRSMSALQGALISVGLVLAAVFTPMAFLSGSTGVIYRQFSATLVIAMALSLLVALTLAPAFCSVLLRRLKPSLPSGRVNRIAVSLAQGYGETVGNILARPLPLAVACLAILLATGWMFQRLPKGYLPDEDQGSVITLLNLPAGSVQERTARAMSEMEQYFLRKEPDARSIFTVVGLSLGGAGQNTGMGFVQLKDWSVRRGKHDTAAAVVSRAKSAAAHLPDGLAYVLAPPPIPGLGQAAGFDFELQDKAGVGHQALLTARDDLIHRARQDPRLSQVRASGLDDVPQLRLDIDYGKAAAQGVSAPDLLDAVSTAWGGDYVNDFIDRGRLKPVIVEGDAPFRSAAQDLDAWFVRGRDGAMSPISSFSRLHWTYGPAQLERYDGRAAFEIQGQAAAGASSGVAMQEMERLAAALPPGLGFAWTGLSRQEKSAGEQGRLLLLASVAFAFLCLAVQYNSVTLPFSVLLVAPLAVFGSVAASSLFGVPNDVYFQLGLLTTVALAAKNAILIVTFARQAEGGGLPAAAAARRGAQARLRPILMTSLAFMAGVAPLLFASGPSAASQHEIGICVLGGMISATLASLFGTPAFYRLGRRPSPHAKAGTETTPLQTRLAGE